MIDSRAKGARFELEIAKKLSSITGLDFKRVPMSGGLHESHQLKGDLYLVNSLNIYCIEVKHYANDQFTSKILTDKDPTIYEWWKQTKREAAQISRKPLLIYKFDRSKVFCAFEEMPLDDYHYRWSLLNFQGSQFYTAKLDDWLFYEEPRFV